ncbi:MAG TPA: deoxyribonuclease IV [Candidatus Acidoferrales bacterium]|nr:deoxyribonuclease IV [Candidatus Acidoferrales bacterium]
MRLGVHVRVSGGYAKAVEYAKSLGCTAMQIFSSNPRSYRVGKLDAPALAAFARMRQEAGIDPCVIHTPYLINLASEDPKVLNGSLGLLRADLASAEAGEIAYVNTHLGSYGTRDRNEGFSAICSALENVLGAIAPGVTLVLENSAGAGNLAGGTLDELGRFIEAVGHPQLGVCLDTAHAWAAGYAIDSREGVDRFLEEAEAKIGLERIPMFHFNDTEVPLGASRDRHYHIGEGLIGFEGFRSLLARAELRAKTAILETPGDEAEDRKNVQTIRTIESALRGPLGVPQDDIGSAL